MEEQPVLELKKKKSSMKLSKKISKISADSGDYYNDYDDMEDDDDDDYGYDDYDDDEDVQASKNQNTGPVLIRDSEIFEKLQEKINSNITDLTNMDFDKSLIIFKHYEFNQESFIQNYFSDSQKIIKKYGLDLGSFKASDGPVECAICFDDENNGIELPCGNSYCYECVAGHIQSKITNKQVFFGCMEEDCKYWFQHSLILNVLDNQNLEKDKKLYLINLSRIYAEECKGIKWCPGVDCDYCIQDEYCQYQNVECSNNHKFCLKCLLPAWHKPCPCPLVKDWNAKNSQQTLDDKWIQANTRKCPHCARTIQRSLGCDFMRCAPPGGCGKAFCYVCLLPITEKEHMAHASCKIKAKNDSQQAAKDYLAKVEQYYDRVKTCQVVQDKAREILKNEIDPQRNILYTKGSISLQESQFLVDAFEILIDSRDALKYSYIFAFQTFVLPETMKNSQALFEDFQKIYESHCEKLAMSLETEMNTFIESIQNFQDAHKHGLEDPNKMKEFFVLKEKINTQAQAINKSKGQMVEAVENGEIYVKE